MCHYSLAHDEADATLRKYAAQVGLYKLNPFDPQHESALEPVM